MTPSDILARLDERFRLLTGGRRTAVERHQTLRAAVEWSYSLLSPVDRAVFLRLGVFSGSFDSAAAESVAANDDVESWDVVDALGGLAAKSMIIAEPADAGTMRYSMLETLRQFARELLDEEGDPDRWRRRHAEHYACLAHEAAPGLMGPDELTWFARWRADADNIRAALSWSLDAQGPSDALFAFDIIGVIGPYTNTSGAILENWPERAVARAQSATPERRMRVLAAAAHSAASLGDRDLTEARSRDAIATATEHQLPPPADAYCALSLALAVIGDRAGAVQAVADGLACVPNEDQFTRVFLHGYAAAWGVEFGDTDTANKNADTAVRLARELQNPSALISALGMLGYALQYDDPPGALVALDEAIALTDAGVGDRNAAIIRAVAARLHASAGRPTRALELLQDGVTRAIDVGERTGLLFAIGSGIVILAGNDAAECAATFAGIMSGPFAASGIVQGGEQMRRLDAVLVELEHRLGSHRYDAAIARGAVMSYDEITEFTRVEINRLLEEAAI
jgi:hypothetical protein